MHFKIPDQYIIGKFFQYTGFPVYKASIRAYNACCPVCREGNSWGKKKRLFYFPHKQQIYCHNCNQGWSPVNWVKQVCDMTFREIQAEVLSGETDKPEINIEYISNSFVERKSLTLPEDSINLFDKEQVLFYKKNKIIRTALSIIKARNIHKAINKCDALYVSLTDFVHKNRLCIPFYDLNGKIIFYQTRKLVKDESPKYLSKMYEEKSVFGIDKIDVSFPYIFILEGPIDAMFIKNGVAVCGTSMTQKQQKQLQQFPTHRLIWCLDNQNLDKTSKEKTGKLIQNGWDVFKWPISLGYKDLNELCVNQKIHQVDPDIIINNLYRYDARHIGSLKLKAFS